MDLHKRPLQSISNHVARMLAIVLFALLAAASAAPRYPFSDERSLESILDDEMFSMKNFLQQFTREMSTLEDRLAEMSRRLPKVTTKEGIEGNEYKIEIPLPGFQESDISVKARKGLLKVTAQHNYGGGSNRNYLIIRNLPDCVGENGDWTYENGVLNIVFPLNKTTSTETEVQTVTPSHSREEIESDNAEHTENADVGVDTSESYNELLTNEVPKSNVEGTTYSEGLKNDYEFVPLSRNQV